MDPSHLKVNSKFDQFFSKIYKERWPDLLDSLQKPALHVLRKNKNSDYDTSSFKPFLNNEDIFEYQDGAHNILDQNNLKVFYKMDPASILVAQSLIIQPGDRVLDMCAAPGGKSLILAEKLGLEGELICNEYSAGRRERLTRVLHEYIPHDLRQHIFVKGQDGNAYGLKQPSAFQAILADVPCSGERHLLENAAEFAVWTEKRSLHLAVRQYSLLASAWLACVEGGNIVYSTCSISPYENDDVVAKAIKKKGVKIQRNETLSKYSFVEETEFGYRVLPDTGGFGPMYFSIMVKT